MSSGTPSDVPAQTPARNILEMSNQIDARMGRSPGEYESLG